MSCWSCLTSTGYFPIYMCFQSCETKEAWTENKFCAFMQAFIYSFLCIHEVWGTSWVMFILHFLVEFTVTSAWSLTSVSYSNITSNDCFMKAHTVVRHHSIKENAHKDALTSVHNGWWSGQALRSALINHCKHWTEYCILQEIFNINAQDFTDIIYW